LLKGAQTLYCTTFLNFSLENVPCERTFGLHPLAFVIGKVSPQLKFYLDAVYVFAPILSEDTPVLPVSRELVCRIACSS